MDLDDSDRLPQGRDMAGAPLIGARQGSGADNVYHFLQPGLSQQRHTEERTKP